MPSGHCSLCGKMSELTFEHVPPRSAFNKSTRYKSVDMLEVLKRDDILDAKFSGKVEQGGVGYFSLCSSCNNFLGINYVPSYTAYSNSFIDFAKKREFNYFEFEMHNFEASKVLKQVVSMFITLNGWKITQHYNELRQYVLDPNSNELPKRFRVFNYLNTGGQLRNICFSTIGGFEIDKAVTVSEITFPPLGHVMTLDFNGSLPFHFELTNFKEFGIHELVSIDFKIFRLPTYLPVPLDYREKHVIQDAIDKGKDMRPTSA
jgi:hypothetical protein